MGAFVIMYSLAILCSFFPEKWMKLATAGVLLIGYAIYVYLTFKQDKADLECPKPCLFDRSCEIPRKHRVIGQVVISLLAIIGLAHFFVVEVKEVSTLIGVNPLVLSLIIAPLATELPEKFNSVIWMRENKDTLALGNIAGAMVFQSTFPVAVGIIFTDWILWDSSNPETIYAILAAVFAIIAGIYFFTLNLLGIRIRSRLLAAPFILYIAYIFYVVLSAGSK
jgi:cation:H+ antiporter